MFTGSRRTRSGRSQIFLADWDHAKALELLDIPEMNMGLVRGGIGVYGLFTSMHVKHDLPLQPVLSLRSRCAFSAICITSAPPIWRSI